MDKLRKEIEKILEEERAWVKAAERIKDIRSHEIDFAMGKIRAYERALVLLEKNYVPEVFK